MQKKVKDIFSGRLKLICLIIILAGAALITRLYYIQIIKGESYSVEADQQYVKSSGRIYDRGSIFFTDKNGEIFSAAGLKSGYTLAISPKTIKNPEIVYERLSSLIDLQKKDFFKKVAKENDPYEILKERLKREDVVKINNLGLTGISTHLQRWRYYPGNDLASQAIGFVAYKKDRKTGVYGMERYYNDVLERDNENLYINFFAKIFSDIYQTISGEKNFSGDVVTSIDFSVQIYLKNRLDEIMEDYDSKLTGGIIMDPTNGKIYAMSARPSFNLNHFEDVSNSSIFSNPSIENVYEMGSIMKALTMSIGLDSGAVTATTTYNDKGSVSFDTETIHNYDKKGRGKVNMQEVLNQSLNTGAVFVEQQIGSKKFASYMKKFGFGEKTNIDLPAETSGLIKNLESSREIEYATASFGQGIAVTPIEMATALSALANGGHLVTPHIGERIKYENGLTKNIKTEKGERVIKKETSKKITEMLIEVVDDALLGGDVDLPRYSIAAKTGTAQIPDLENGGYYSNRYLHSFFGYLPARKPRFLVFLYALEPKNVRYASHTLGPPFMNIAEFLINYYKIPPDR